MPANDTSKLYSPALLALSTSLADFPLRGDFAANAEARSRTCGSTIALGLDLDDGAKISRIGMRVSACAVGQSSAAIMAREIRGTDAELIVDTKLQIERWLAGSEKTPDWPGIDALVPALPHKGRHDAILLPWRAAVEALSTLETAR